MTRLLRHGSTALLILMLWPVKALGQGLDLSKNCPLAQGGYSGNAGSGFSESPPDAAGSVAYTGTKGVVLVCGQIQLNADEITLIRDKKGDNHLTAIGHVAFIDLATRIVADRLEFDLKSKTGTFFNAAGQLGLAAKGRVSAASAKRLDASLFGGHEPDAFFNGERVDKTGPKTYRIKNGSFTTCTQPTPRWQLDVSSATITLEEHAVLTNVVLKVKSVPLFYLPFMIYPVKSSDRTTGFLLPNYGTSTVRGFTFSNAFFWAIDRSQDMTFYQQWFSQIGQGFGAEYRFVPGPLSQGTLKFNGIFANAQAAAVTGGSSLDLNGNVTEALTKNVQLQAVLDFPTSLATKELLQQNIADFTQRTRQVGVNATGSFGRYRISAQTQFQDTFYGVTSATRYGHLPSVSFSMAQAPIGDTKINYLLNASTDTILDYPTLGQPNVGLTRLDLQPTIRAPIGNLNFLTISTSASWRISYWSQSLDASGNRVATPVTRPIFDLQASFVGPTVLRVFDTPSNGYAAKFEHVIEPSLTVERISGFSTYDRIIKLDGFDYVVGGTTKLDYSLSNQLWARRRLANGQTAPREILSVTIDQSYYTDPTASTTDPQYQATVGSGTAGHFSPVAIETSLRVTDSVTGDARFQYNPQVHAFDNISVGSSVRTALAQVSTSWLRQFTAAPGTTILTETSHAINTQTTLHSRDNRMGLNWSWNYDVLNGYMLQQTFASNISSQCCGLLAEYQTVRLPVAGINGQTQDHRFTLAFTLAGIGTFANPLGSFGAFIGK